MLHVIGSNNRYFWNGIYTICQVIVIAIYFKKLPCRKQILKSVGDRRQTSYPVYSNKFELPILFLSFLSSHSRSSTRPTLMLMCGASL